MRELSLTKVTGKSNVRHKHKPIAQPTIAINTKAPVVDDAQISPNEEFFDALESLPQT
jgi:hypothetical protein